MINIENYTLKNNKNNNDKNKKDKKLSNLNDNLKTNDLVSEVKDNIKNNINSNPSINMTINKNWSHLPIESQNKLNVIINKIKLKNNEQLKNAHDNILKIRCNCRLNFITAFLLALEE